MLNVTYESFMLSVAMLSVVMLSVVAQHLLPPGQGYKTLRIGQIS